MYIENSRVTTKKRKKKTDMLKIGEKVNHIKCSIITTKCRRVEDKKKSKKWTTNKKQ